MTILETSPEADIDDLVFECDLDAPPQKVWRALTEPAYVAAWLMPGNSEAPGFSSRVDCEVLAAEPPHRLRYAWREQDGGQTLDSTVTFELDANRDGGTHLRIIHGDFVSTPIAANANQPAMLLRAA